MADQKNFDMTPDQFADAIGRAVAEGLAKNAPPKKISVGQYLRRGGHSPFHPNKGPYKKLIRDTYVVGYKLLEDTLTDREIELLNLITHSGRYIERKVEVVVSDEGAEERLDLRWNCKTSDQRNDVKGIARNLTDMLQQIFDAQEIERAEAKERDDKKEIRRTFGNNRAFKEAQERASAAA